MAKREPREIMRLVKKEMKKSETISKMSIEEKVEVFRKHIKDELRMAKSVRTSDDEQKYYKVGRCKTTESILDVFDRIFPVTVNNDVKVNKPPKNKEFYKFNIRYVIGDSNGYTSEKGTISEKNPFLKCITSALDELIYDTGKVFSCVLDKETYDYNLKEKTISELQYDLLFLLTCNPFDFNVDLLKEKFFKKYGFENTEENSEYLEEFDGLLISDTAYSWVSYDSYKLK